MRHSTKFGSQSWRGPIPSTRWNWVMNSNGFHDHGFRSVTRSQFQIRRGRLNRCHPAGFGVSNLCSHFLPGTANVTNPKSSRSTPK
jgi:hypothetical protein